MRKSSPTKEVIAVPELLHPDPALSHDQQKKEALQEALERDLRLAGSKIEVAVQDDVATLQGAVASSAARMAADFDAQAVRGIGRVRNELEIPGKDQEPLVEPAKMQEEAVQMIAAEEDLAGTEVEVSASAGKLTLTGFVSSPEQEQKIHGIALKVPGVLEVINKISVVPSNEEADYRIGQEINERLYKNIYVDVNTVDVMVNHGRVTLSGYVERTEDLHHAKESGQVPGVKEINLDLLVIEQQRK